jgi:mannose-6-phosphate isomerase-like protein (cupin superfamily)
MKALALSFLLLAAAPNPQDIRGQGLLSPDGAPRQVDPTWLRASIPQVAVGQGALSSASAHYKPLFGENAPSPRLSKGVSRYGELTVDPGGRSAVASFAREEHVLVFLEGEGPVGYNDQQQAVRRHDFVYIPPGVRFSVASRNNQRVRTMVMGFRVPESHPIVMPSKLMVANMDDVEPVLVGGHPPSAKFRLLLGDTTSTRDRIASGQIIKSLFILEIQPNGTNFPHHHESEEEIYMVLEGQGDIVAGSGLDGVEGKFPAKVGDTYYYRPNTTVGFYTGSSPARILAIRSSAPLARE